MVTTPASSITKAASKQTYYTIRFLADRDRVEDAYRAYGYFRWVDDILDRKEPSRSRAEAVKRITFLERQKSLLEKCLRGQAFPDPTLEERMLVALAEKRDERNNGLQAYLNNMMQLMDFDTRRRGRWISQVELNEYTCWLATAVTEAIHYFIGHDSYVPCDDTRYLAVSAAHITHMLRDTFEDANVGYYNIPHEVLMTNHMGPLDVQTDAYRAWVKSRVELAREDFKAGKAYFARVANPRCRLACFAYIARFEWLLDTIEREGYRLRPHYSERKSALIALRIGWSTLSSLINLRGAQPGARAWNRPRQFTGKK